MASSDRSSGNGKTIICPTSCSDPGGVFSSQAQVAQHFTAELETTPCAQIQLQRKTTCVNRRRANPRITVMISSSERETREVAHGSRQTKSGSTMIENFIRRIIFIESSGSTAELIIWVKPSKKARDELSTPRVIFRIECPCVALRPDYRK